VKAGAVVAEFGHDLRGVDLTTAGQALQERAIGVRIEGGRDGGGELLDPGDEFAQAQLGWIDYGVLGATQSDLHGNINSTMLGDDWRRPRKRFPGAGGANEVASYCWRTIVITMHEARRFVPPVDFVTSPGYLGGTPGARERAGLPAGTGPWRVVTSKAPPWGPRTGLMSPILYEPAKTVGGPAGRQSLRHA
jgi:hypothetical protein